MTPDPDGQFLSFPIDNVCLTLKDVAEELSIGLEDAFNLVDELGLRATSIEVVEIEDLLEFLSASANVDYVCSKGGDLRAATKRAVEGLLEIVEDLG